MGSLVSILTPCFEHEPYLGDYFESLLAQSYPDIEVIFYDDASRDRSWPVAQSFEARLRDRFRHVTLRRNGVNHGLLATLEKMKSEINGDIVCILESDDYLYPTKIEKNVAFLSENPDIGLVHSDADFFIAKEDRFIRSYWKSRGRNVRVGDVFEQLLYENFILTCTFACRASLFKNHADLKAYRKRGYRTADYPVFLDLSRQAPFGYIDRSLAVYRVLPGSISHPRDEIGRLEWELDYFKIKRDYIHDPRCSGKIRKRAEAQYHLRLIQLGWASGRADVFDEGYDWLREHDAGSIGKWVRHVQKKTIRHKLLRRWIRRLEKSSL